MGYKFSVTSLDKVTGINSGSDSWCGERRVTRARQVCVANRCYRNGRRETGIHVHIVSSLEDAVGGCSQEPTPVLPGLHETKRELLQEAIIPSREDENPWNTRSSGTAPARASFQLISMDEDLMHIGW